MQEEVEYIKSKGRMYETINLNEPLEKIKKTINNFNKRNSIFISYTHHDQKFANDLYDELIKNEYKAFLDRISIMPGSVFIDEITNAINDAVKHGYIICLISEYYLSSTFAKNELSFALEKSNSKIIKIYLSNPSILEEQIQANYAFNHMLKDMPYIDATILASIKEVVERITQIDLELHKNK